MEIKLYCKFCGHELKIEAFTPVNGGIGIRVNVCNVCFDEIKAEGFEEGQEQGYSEGLIAGQTQ